MSRGGREQCEGQGGREEAGYYKDEERQISEIQQLLVYPSPEVLCSCNLASRIIGTIYIILSFHIRGIIFTFSH